MICNAVNCRFKKTKKMKKIALAFMMLAAFSVAFTSCKKKPKDEDIKAAIEKVVPAGIGVAVAEGSVTLTGKVETQDAFAAAEIAAKAVEGVKGITNKIEVVPPVVINPDETLTQTVNAAIAAFAGIKAEVKDGVVTLSGNIKKDDLAKVMQAVQELKPKKVENKMNVIK
jgi:osmotically-inducible protein OsmY